MDKENILEITKSISDSNERSKVNELIKANIDDGLLDSSCFPLVLNEDENNIQLYVVCRDMTKDPDGHWMDLLSDILINFCNNHPLNQKEVFHIESILYELIMNIYEHTYKMKDCSIIGLNFEVNDTHFRIIIHDWGQPLNAEIINEKITNFNEEESFHRERGLGLQMIKEVASEYRFNFNEREKRNETTIDIKLQ